MGDSHCPLVQDLNRRDPEAVVRQYEGGQVPASEATLAEYVKALGKLDRLDGSALIRTLQQGALVSPTCRTYSRSRRSPHLNRVKSP
jgi:hypothetical protein